MFYQNPIFWGVLALTGLIAGYFIRQLIAVRQASSVERKIKQQLEDSKAKAKEIILESQKKAADILGEIKKEEREQKLQLGRLEERLLKKEELLEKDKSDLRLEQEKTKEDVEKIKAAKNQLAELKQKLTAEFEKIAKLSETEAREKILEETKSKYQKDLTEIIQKISKERKEEIERKGVEIMTTAIQRMARSVTGEVTTTVFNLDEDLKGKIIGREGRNIRTLEKETGADFIIDETPNTIVISSFDPVRRETARLALEKLIKDGRIQPAKIEEKVEEARQEINKTIAEKGEEAAYEVGVYGLPREIVQLLGRLYFRTSFGQNVLNHSIECAHLAGMMATELGLNAETAKVGALLHDIGKAVDQEVAGTHVELGQRILKKFGVSEDVIKAMQAHHEEYPFSTPESYIVAAADAISGARPGARRDTVENYLKRLEELERLAKGFEGIKNVYAVSAGREVRVFVTPEKIDDFGALQLARDIAAKIQSELKYPGEIKVNVIRETRAVEYAR